MRELMLYLGKDFGKDAWSIFFSTQTKRVILKCTEGFRATRPFAGCYLTEDEIKDLIRFLQEILEESNE